MTTVTAFTAERMQTIEDETVVDGNVVGDDLVLVRRDGVEINAGNVRGPQGVPGGAVDFAGYVEPLDDRGDVAGLVTLDFATFNVWRINPTAAVTLAFSNLPAAGFIAPGTIIVANSAFGITWPAGTKFPQGLAPVLSGETWLTIVGRSTHITAGVGWAGVV